MDFWAKIALVIGVFDLTFMLNIPFGVLRSRTKKFSFLWFLCIHLPIPVVFMGRLFSHLDYKYIPIFVFAAFLGQVMGGRLKL